MKPSKTWRRRWTRARYSQHSMRRGVRRPDGTRVIHVPGAMPLGRRERAAATAALARKLPMAQP